MPCNNRALGKSTGKRRRDPLALGPKADRPGENSAEAKWQRILKEAVNKANQAGTDQRVAAEKRVLELETRLTEMAATLAKETDKVENRNDQIKNMKVDMSELEQALDSTADEAATLYVKLEEREAEIVGLNQHIETITACLDRLR